MKCQICGGLIVDKDGEPRCIMCGRMPKQESQGKEFIRLQFYFKCSKCEKIEVGKPDGEWLIFPKACSRCDLPLNPEIRTAEEGTAKRRNGYGNSRLREIRKNRRMTQQGLQESSGVWSTRISAIERGHAPKGDEREKLAKALGMAMEEIFP